MARPLRIDRAGGWYHVTGRGNQRRSIYREDKDRIRFCQLLAEMVVRFRVKLHGYVLMENHYHLILELTEPNLSRAVQWLNVSYSVWFNHRHQRSGHLFQGRFKSVAVDWQEWGLELSRYVHLNPVRVGQLGLNEAERQRMAAGVSAKPNPQLIGRRIKELEGYRWSSYRAYIGLVKEPGWLECDAVLEQGGGKSKERRRDYRAYVISAIREGLVRNPWEALKEQVALGGDEFLKRIRRHMGGGGREKPRSKRLANGRPTLAEVIAAVEKLKEEKWAAFRDRYGDSGRDLVLYIGRRACGMKLWELAVAAGMKDYAAVAAAIARLEKGPKNAVLAAQLKRLSEKYNI